MKSSIQRDLELREISKEGSSLCESVNYEKLRLSVQDSLLLSSATLNHSKALPRHLRTKLNKKITEF